MSQQEWLRRHLKFLLYLHQMSLLPQQKSNQSSIQPFQLNSWSYCNQWCEVLNNRIRSSYSCWGYRECVWSDPRVDWFAMGGNNNFWHVFCSSTFSNPPRKIRAHRQLRSLFFNVSSSAFFCKYYSTAFNINLTGRESRDWKIPSLLY